MLQCQGRWKTDCLFCPGLSARTQGSSLLRDEHPPDTCQAASPAPGSARARCWPAGSSHHPMGSPQAGNEDPRGGSPGSCRFWEQWLPLQPSGWTRSMGCSQGRGQGAKCCPQPSEISPVPPRMRPDRESGRYSLLSHYQSCSTFSLGRDKEK